MWSSSSTTRHACSSSRARRNSGSIELVLERPSNGAGKKSFVECSVAEQAKTTEESLCDRHLHTPTVLIGSLSATSHSTAVVQQQERSFDASSAEAILQHAVVRTSSTNSQEMFVGAVTRKKTAEVVNYQKECRPLLSIMPRQDTHAPSATHHITHTHAHTQRADIHTVILHRYQCLGITSVCFARLLQSS